MAATICPRPVTLTFDLEVGVGVACAKMLRIDAFVIRRSRLTNILKFQTGVLCYNKEIITQIGNIIFISQNQTLYIFIQQNLHENDYSVLL